MPPPAVGTVAPVTSEGTVPQQLVSAHEPVAAEPLDAESRRWLQELAGTGAAHDDAVLRLHALLLRAARYEIGRRRHAMPFLRGDDYDDLAQQSADDALVAVLRKLDTFRGDSRFTTWVYKFALYEAAVKLRRRAWQDRELTLQPDAWPAFASTAPSPGERLEERELLTALRNAIGERLSAHQREVLVAVTISGVPIDVLAERLNTTRGALYKTLHDARKKLRAELALAGFDIAHGDWEHGS